MTERQEKAILAARVLFGEKFPVHKYLKWASFPDQVQIVQKEVLYPGCGHQISVDNKEKMKLSISEGHCPKGLCPICRIQNWEQMKERAAMKEKALVSLSELWPE